MVVQEIEDEITYTHGQRERIERLSAVERARARLDEEVGAHKSLLNQMDRAVERGGLTPEAMAELEAGRRAKKAELDTLRRALREATEIADALEREVEEGFNPYWGLLFKEGNENSRFGEQVERYACLYTSRVSNFLYDSPLQYYRSPRDLMPHEQAGSWSALLAPEGGDTPAPGGER